MRTPELERIALETKTVVVVETVDDFIIRDSVPRFLRQFA